MFQQIFRHFFKPVTKTDVAHQGKEIPKNENIYLTDEQYWELLIKIYKTVSASGFDPQGYDSTSFGDKYTETNCGFCNDNFTTKETALFPDDFPERKSMKYGEIHHKCPFDSRPMNKLDINGCFYTCLIFKNPSIKTSELITLINERRKEVMPNGASTR